MLSVFLNAVLPVFAVVAVGFAAGQFRLVSRDEATILNRFVLLLPLPVLLFRVVGTTEVAYFLSPALALYIVAEASMYAAGFAVARFVFRRPADESLLLGLAITLVNHVYYVYPIALGFMGEDAAEPIAVVMAFDAVVMFGGTTIAMDFLRGGTSRLEPMRLAGIFARNPQIIGLAAGLALLVSGLPLTGGFELFTRFVGDAAAPTSLFALGVILSMPSRRTATDRGVLVAFTGLKLVAMPAVLLFAALLFPVGQDDAFQALLLVAAGPCGAMAFVLALQYRVDPTMISRLILVTTVGSVATLSFVSQL